MLPSSSEPVITEEPLTAPAPLELLNPEQIITGPPLDPLARVKTYSAEEFEGFIAEWVFYFLQLQSGVYSRVAHLGGSGDKGRDVIGYFSLGEGLEGCDVFQCKHYDHGLYPGDIWVELGKLCLFTYLKAIPIPRQFRFVAPHDAGPEVVRLLDRPTELKVTLIEKWATDCETKITRGKRVPLTGELLAHVEQYDFSAVKCKPIHEVIAEHATTIRRAPRFGGGLNKMPEPDPLPPEAIGEHEARYVEQLMAAYADKLRIAIMQAAGLGTYPEIDRHFHRSRRRFYSAEALRVFARDNLPENVTFEEVQDQVLDAVIDRCTEDHPDGFARVVATTTAAASVSITNHYLRHYLKPQSLQGICHQLANDDRLRWVP